VRILFLDQFSDLGGAQLCLQDVLREASRRDWQAEVLAPGSGPLLKFARELGFPVHSLPLVHYANGHKTIFDVLRFGADIAWTARTLRTVLRKRAADLIYVNGPRILPAVSGLGVPVLFHSHSAMNKRYSRIIAGRVLRRCRARALACSEFIAQPLRTMLGADRVSVVYNGVAEQGFCPRRATAAPLRVGILGRIAPEKGHLDFLRAAAAIPDRKSVQFSIIGTALFSHARYEQTVQAAGAAAAVEFRGWTNNVSQALHELDVLTVPSASEEASGRVILEAFSAGTCVIAYPSGGIPELIRDGENGLLAKSSSPEGLVALVQALAANPALRARLAINGRREWEARFKVQRFRSDVCDALSAAVTSPALFPRGGCSTPAEQSCARDENFSVP
jgi:glycosyltransferase involved in cell wall biosynthesis